MEYQIPRFKKTITIFLMDYVPTKRIKCHVDGTTCIAFKINREDLKNSDNRKELSHAGIYFLFGGGSEQSVVYIGQAGSRKNGTGTLIRLLEHDRNPEKNYWSEAVIMTTTDNSLGATELNFLENYFCSLARNADRYIVKNENEPHVSNISEEKQCTLEEFAYYAELILGVLNYKVFVPLAKNTEDIHRQVPHLYLSCKKRNGETINAIGQQTENGFVVFKGSYIAKDEHADIPEKIRNMRQTARIDKQRILQEDIMISSPSYAGSFVIGQSCNGLTKWKTKEGVPLKKILEAENTKTIK